MDKERRDTIRNRIDEGGNFSDILAEIYFSKTKLRALLDLADERDRYRALLDKILTVQRDNYGDATMTHIRLYQPCEGARAALEGKTND